MSADTPIDGSPIITITLPEGSTVDIELQRERLDVQQTINGWQVNCADTDGNRHTLPVVWDTREQAQAMADKIAGRNHLAV